MTHKPHHNVTPSTPSDSSLSPTKPLFTSAYSPKIKSQLTFSEQGRTKQSFKDECDINTIMRRYAVTGQLSHVSSKPPAYLDTPAIDFQNAMFVVADARERFASLPSHLRDRFGNDPAQLLAFLENADNLSEAVKLGLAIAPVVPSTPDDKSSPPSSKPPA